MNKNKNENAIPPIALKIAIVETRPIFRRGLAGVFTESWESAALIEAGSVEELTSLPGDQGPAIILIGLESEKDRNSIQQIAGLNVKYPSAKIIIYDYRDDLKMIPRLLNLGVFGYLVADFDVSELRLCLNTILQGKKYISNEIVWEYLNHESEVINHAKARLSKTEEVVAAYLTQGMSVTRIAETMNRQISTISTIKAKIFKKMRVANVLELKDRLQKDPSPVPAASV